jgi:replicative DNA helicase
MTRRPTPSAYPALPHSEKAERAVLGALLLEPARLAQVRNRLEPRDWYLERHRTLFQACLDLADAGSTPDLLTLQAHLDQAGQLDAAGGPAYLAALDLDLPDLGRLDEYVEIVKERSLRRDLFAVNEQVRQAVLTTAQPVSELFANLRDTAEANLGHSAPVRWQGAGTVLDRLLETLDTAGPRALGGLTTGFPAWDQLGPGLLPGGLYVIAGRPGMGKTSLALDLTRHVAVELQRPTGVFSLEMRADELGLKLGSADAGIAAHHLRTNHLSRRQWRDLAATTRRFTAAPLFLDDSPSLTLRDLETRALWLKANHPDLALLVVDFLQLLTAGIRIEHRRLEIAHITRRLKELAGKLGLVLVALSQLNRELTRRSDPRPHLGDLAESDAIGQYADQVAFVHRPEVYTPDNEGLRGLAEIIVAKHRHGATGTVTLTWTGATTSFHNPNIPARTGPEPR